MPWRKGAAPPGQGLFDFLPIETVVTRTVVEVVVPEAPQPPEKIETRKFSVAELVRAASRTLEARFSDVWVEGEISNLSTPRSGHVYFTLKDAEAQLPAVMFRTQAARLKFALKDGLKVLARGRCSIYDAQGKFQFYADSLEPVGVGAIQLAFEQLKQKMAAEGLFDAVRKRALPAWPKTVGVVTSATGAAVRDILRVADRRGRVNFVIAPCQVQGASAPAEILAALKLLQRHPGIDVIIIGRGGGSVEDLAAFNDEALCRAIAACTVPIVSAVGHEVDFTIADFVADLRAPTPSAAAELVVPVFADAEHALEEAGLRLQRAGKRVLADAAQKLEGHLERAQGALSLSIARRRQSLQAITQRLGELHPAVRVQRDRAQLQALQERAQNALKLSVSRRRQGLHAVTQRLSELHPSARVHRDRAQLRSLEQRAIAASHRVLVTRRQLFAGYVGKLDALSPLSVLERGYSLVRDDKGAVVRAASEVAVGDTLQVRLHRGAITARVEKITDKGDKPT